MVSVSESSAVGDDRWGLPMKRGSNGGEMTLNSICLRATGLKSVMRGGTILRGVEFGCWPVGSQLYDNVNISYT